MGKKDDKPKEPEVGLVFPRDNNDGRKSTFGGKQTLGTAIGSVNATLQDKLLREKNWRQNYYKYIVEQVKEGSKSEENALKIARAGLDYCYNNFEYIAHEGATPVSFEEALKANTKESFETGYIKGKYRDDFKNHTVPEYKVPYNGSTLSGDNLRKQLDDWVKYGTIEESAADGIKYVLDNPHVCDLTDKYFVLLGAGSAMGPLPILLSMGANIIAIDVDFQIRGKYVWERLIQMVEDSPGAMYIPMKEKMDVNTEDRQALYANCGANLFSEAPRVRNWLLSVEPNKQLTVGAYAYLDGEKHVKVSLAMDAIIRDLTKKRKANAAYLCTPTDCHLIPEEAAMAAKENYSAFSLTNLILAFSIFKLWPGKLLKNYNKPINATDSTGKDYESYYVDGIVNRQGPNYIFAKRIQHWRAQVARYDDNCIVSSNVAPSTATVSVTSNKLFALAYKGWKFFKPMEVFQPETSNAVMAALLLHDINNTEAPVHPKQKLRNPLEIFMYGSIHGGLWRNAYTCDSSLSEPAAVLYLLSTPAGFLTFVSFIVAIAAIVCKVAGIL